MLPAALSPRSLFPRWTCTSQRLWRSMLTWKSFLAEREANLETVRTALVAARDGRMRAWNQWEGLLDGYRRLRNAMARLSGAMLVKGVNTWVEYSTEQRRLRFVISHFGRYNEVNALRAWRANSRRTPQRLARLVGRYRDVLSTPRARSLLAELCKPLPTTPSGMYIGRLVSR